MLFEGTQCGQQGLNVLKKGEVEAKNGILVRIYLISPFPLLCTIGGD